MKLLSICDPTRYKSPPLDVPTFYQRLSADQRIEFFHLPTPQVFAGQLPQVAAVPSSGPLTYTEFVTLGDRPPNHLSLEDIDVVFCRTLKPFPPGYLDRLSQWETWTRFVNSPTHKRQQLKPDFLLKVADGFIPETIVTADVTEALAFFEQFQTIVAKQANSTGGRGVYKIWYQQSAFQVDNAVAGTRTFPDFAAAIAHLQAGQTEPLQFCRFLHRTDAGDKRVVVVDGEIYGSYLRRSRRGHWVNNVSIDGECSLAEISAAEIEAIQHTAKHYQALGLHTLGYDFLMDNDGNWRISEINAGNIGGFARLELLTGQPVMDRFIGWLIDYAQRPKHSLQRPLFPIKLGAA
jgi:glutathione synthase/RimK-type ligase-like ATP-grasp enzyme